MGIVEGVGSTDDGVEVEDDKVGDQADGGHGGDKGRTVGGDGEERLWRGRCELGIETERRDRGSDKE